MKQLGILGARTEQSPAAAPEVASTACPASVVADSFTLQAG